MDHPSLAGISLQACLEELRRRCQAVGHLQGGHTHLHEELRIFEEFAGEQGWLDIPTPPELSLPPSDHGNEHQVWFRELNRTFLKATWPGFFGINVVHRLDEDPELLQSIIWNAGIGTTSYSRIKFAFWEP